MAVLQIKRFMLRYEGRLYKAGEKVELEEATAKALAEESAGAFVVIADTESSEANPQPVADKRKSTRAKK